MSQLKHLLIWFCEVCDKRGKGRINEGMQTFQFPDGWGVRQWPSGHVSLVCSKRCSSEVEKQSGKHSIVLPGNIHPGVLGRQ